MWAPPESSDAASRRIIFGSSTPWAELTFEDVAEETAPPTDVDIADITVARQALDAMEQTRRDMATTLRAQQRQYVMSRDFLTQQRQEVISARESLSRARAELERRGVELEERECGLAQREAAIDASGTAEQLQQQLTELRAELDGERARFADEQQSQMDGWHRTMATHEEKLISLNSELQALQVNNKELQQRLNQATIRSEAQLQISRNSAAEFDRITALYKQQKDEAFERLEKVEESLRLQTKSLENVREQRRKSMPAPPAWRSSTAR